MRLNNLGIVRTNIERPDAADVARLPQFGVATVHEAMGRVGLLRPYIRPVYTGAKLCGPAVTVLLQPGDNWMFHVAAEQVQAGDIIVAGCTTESEDGFFGELLASSLTARGCKGLVIDGGVRDIADLEKMDAWQQLRLFQARERKRTSSVKFSLFRYVVIDAHL